MVGACTGESRGEMKPPERIWLQFYDEFDGEESEDITWCVDHINETDVEYVRADLPSPVVPSSANVGQIGEENG